MWCRGLLLLRPHVEIRVQLMCSRCPQREQGLSRQETVCGVLTSFLKLASVKQVVSVRCGLAPMLSRLCLVLGTEADADKGDLGGLDGRYRGEKKQTPHRASVEIDPQA